MFVFTGFGLLHFDVVVLFDSNDGFGWKAGSSIAIQRSFNSEIFGGTLNSVVVASCVLR